MENNTFSDEQRITKRIHDHFRMVIAVCARQSDLYKRVTIQYEGFLAALQDNIIDIIRTELYQNTAQNNIEKSLQKSEN